jgi:hypothetical protein
LWFLLTHTNPGVLLNSFEAIPYLFMGNRSWPLSDTKNRDFVRRYELYFAIFSLVGLISAFRWFITQHNKKKIFTTWFAPILSLLFCVYLFKSELRYRFPFDIWIIPLSVKGWIELLQRPSQVSKK